MTRDEALANLDWILPPILKSIHQGNYDAPPVRRVYIPKANGGKRPLGVPSIIDRAIQAATATILNQIYEQDFLPCSFGFRPGLSCHHALATINKILLDFKMDYALEVDLRDFFGSLSHEWLRKFLGLRIGDHRVLKLIDAWLKAGVMENGQIDIKESGSPQGGSISPLLSNIYLHYVLDLWFEKKIKKQLDGKAHLVRYADDYCFFFRTEAEAQTMKTLLTARLAQFGLTIADDKTHMTDLTLRQNKGGDRRRITFLGFAIFRAARKSGSGWKTMFQAESSRFTRAKLAMKEKLWAIKHFDLKQQTKIINAILVGHFNYYGFAGNSPMIVRFWNLTIAYWRRCLSRRSNQLVSWDKMNEILRTHSLKAPTTRISYRDLKAYVRL